MKILDISQSGKRGLNVPQARQFGQISRAPAFPSNPRTPSQMGVLPGGRILAVPPSSAGINPKSETRSPKQIQRSKAEMVKTTPVSEVSVIEPLGI
jgi:hypothetical protein